VCTRTRTSPTRAHVCCVRWLAGSAHFLEYLWLINHRCKFLKHGSNATAASGGFILPNETFFECAARPQTAQHPKELTLDASPG